MVGWHHSLNGHGFGWTPGVGDGQGVLVCWDSWGDKKLDMTEQLNLTELNCGVGEDLVRPLDRNKIQPVYSKGNQS